MLSMVFLPKRSLILGLQRYTFIDKLKIKFKKFFNYFFSVFKIKITKQKTANSIVIYSADMHIFIPNYKPINMKALWNNQVIAESNDTVVVENNHYFPKSSVKAEFLKDSNTHSTCPWKGLASYYTLEVDGKQNPDAAWYYPEPKEAAANIKDHVAFWKGVKITE